ncbi:MAG: SPOR domain-containing protein [Candidatus Aminicenantales bacterium]
MSKSDEYREMQISSGQLAAVIFSLLALCVLIFYLGIRVGTKKATDDAAAAALKTPTQSAAPAKRIPAEPKPAEQTIPRTDLAAVNPPVAETKAKPAETKPAAKVETKPAAAEKKPAAIETKPKTEPAKTKTAAGPSGTFYVQAGAVDTRPGAETLAQKIEGLGFRAIVLNPFAGDKKPLYRVRVGPYETKADAVSARDKLAAVLKKKPADFLIKTG